VCDDDFQPITSAVIKVNLADGTTVSYAVHNSPTCGVHWRFENGVDQADRNRVMPFADATEALVRTFNASGGGGEV